MERHNDLVTMLLFFSIFFHFIGVEDGQTVRMPVGSKEIFITFKVSPSRAVVFSSIIKILECDFCPVTKCLIAFQNCHQT